MNIKNYLSCEHEHGEIIMKSSLQYYPQSNCIVVSHTCEDGNMVLKRNLVVFLI